ncbi:MAG: alpha-amylase family glycosyl hydrolase [Chloroflexales bacterium]|nr:alpha-amylase family glycosyl hydrolase [Chloroflexales bacterium]
MTPTQNTLWWQRGVIYQIYPRSFVDTNGDGIGDLPGVIERLSYLSDTLGVDAIWLSPIYPSPMQDFGYDVANYTDIDPLFGDLATFDRLLVAAHQHGLKVIIDWVPNHTSDQHPWFRESRSSHSSSRRDWYVWRDPKADGAPPNNWLSFFGGPAWTWDAATEQYYLHSFLSCMPDLNWRNPDVQSAMFDIVRFWLDRGVDGLRIDTAHYIMKDRDLRDNPPNPAQGYAMHRAMGDYDSQLHLYDKGDPDVHAIFRDLRRLLDDYSHEQPRMAIGEIHIYDWPTWAGYYGQHSDELHMPYNFGLLNIPWEAQAVRRLVETLEATLAPNDWPNYVLGNHDEPRIASRVGAAQAQVALLLLLTLRGTPTLYYGDELGMENTPIAPDQVQDPWERNVPGLGLGRDGERTPMQWTNEPHAGFCPPDVAPWLPVAPYAATMNVARQLQEPHSMLSLTRQALALRRTSEALGSGGYQTVANTPDDCFVYLRDTAQEQMVIALNFSNEARDIDLSKFGAAMLALSTYLDRSGSVDAASLTLRPNEGCVLRIEAER